MKGLPEERTIRLAQYMVEENATVRQTAARFGVSKSTVHKDITTRLKKLNAVLYDSVQEVLRTNKQERHIRGGMATREKYRAKAEERKGGKN
ncbi:MAG TPA: sporulation transcriptional regulator SpoIIID [Candidatus Agathobaculum merdigallinarum]|nr:sporulation transcriptional regulator SpoIIID [Candidatus Agathobaculum merdigallinarum]